VTSYRVPIENTKFGTVWVWVQEFGNDQFVATIDGTEYDLPITQAPAGGEPPATSLEAAVSAMRRALDTVA
jgi:hypothetical protein